MERLIIDVPENKSKLVKQLLLELGVTIQHKKQISLAEYKQKLLSVSVWSDDDLKVIEEARKAFEFKPEEW